VSAGEAASVVIDIDPEVAAKMAKGAMKTPEPIPFTNTRFAQASNFYLYGKNRSAKQWVFLSDVLSSMSWSDDIESGAISGSISLVNGKTLYGSRVSDYLSAGGELRLFYLPAHLDIGTVEDAGGAGLQEIGRFIVWEDTLDTSASGDTMSVKFYDQMKYLIESEITVLFNKGSRKAFTPTEMTRRIAKEQGIPLGVIPQTKAHIDYFYAEGDSIFDVLVKIWTLDHKESGYNYVMYFDKGRLQIRRKAKDPKKAVSGKVLELSANEEGGVVLSASSTRTMEGMVTSMKVWGTALDPAVGSDKRQMVASASYVNKTAVKTYGRIHKELVFDGITNKARLSKSARKNVTFKSKLTRYANVSLLGIPGVRAGTPVRVNVPGAGITGPQWFKSIEHSLEGSGSYTASGELRAYDYSLLLTTDDSDLKPDEVDDPTADFADYGVLDYGSGVAAAPEEVKTLIRSAASFAGVPEAWADSPALSDLIAHESSFVWTNKNPTSTAYGLFQFLDSTWAGVGIKKSWAMPKEMGGEGGHAASVGSLPGGAQGPPAPTFKDWKWWMVVAGLKYIKNRYRTPEAAWAFWQAQSPHWY
jgi:hypothetical protein